MSNGKNTDEELTALKREAAEIRDRRDAEAVAADRAPATEPQEAHGPPESDDETGSPDVRDLLGDLARDVEELAVRKPLLTALGAFVLGVVVGRASRR